MPLVGDKTVTIPLTTEGEWVEVKERLGKYDRTAVQKAILGEQRVAVGKEAGPNGIGDVESILAANVLEAAEWATLERAIVRWSFYEGPPKPADIRRLEDEDYDLIVAKLNELYPSARAEVEQGNSGGSGATTS